MPWLSRCLPLTAVLTLALPAAAQARLPAPSLYGLNTGTFDNDYRHFVRDIPTAGRLGARWVHLSGDNVHSRAGRVDFSILDLQVRWARQRHLGVLITLGGIRDACSQAHLRDRPEHCPPLTARDLRRYGSYEATLLRRYRGQVDYFESWNEPNHRSFWSTGPDPAAYARLLTTQYRVMRSVAPHDHLLFAATGGTELAFINSTLDALGGKQAFDAVGLHPYRFPPRPVFTAGGIQAVDGNSLHLDFAGELLAAEQLFSDHGFGRPRMWLTEFGWPGNGHAGDDYHPDEAAQARAVGQSYRLLRDDRRLRFVQSAFWFNLRDYAPRLANPDPEFFAHYGLLHNDFSLKPAGRVYRQLAHGGQRARERASGSTAASPAPVTRSRRL